VIAISVIISSCESNYSKKLNQLNSKKYCLNKNQTQKLNNISLGNGSLTLRNDNTFLIQNDSLKFSNIEGHWDLCCEPKWAFTVFKPSNHIRQMCTGNPEFEIKVDDKTYTLSFEPCQ